jgi:hypothetical protein
MPAAPAGPVAPVRPTMFQEIFVEPLGQERLAVVFFIT